MQKNLLFLCRWRLEFNDDFTSFTASVGRGVMPSSSGKLVPQLSNEPEVRTTSTTLMASTVTIMVTITTITTITCTSGQGAGAAEITRRS